MIRLHYKLLLAAASGVACGFIYLIIDGEPGGAFPSWHWAVSILVPGTLFGTTVLFPYLRRDRWLYLRAIGLIAISTFSYRSAIVVAVDSNILDASVVGAGIVVLGAMFIAPLRLTFAHILTGLGAGVIGGILFHTLMDIDELVAVYAAFASWHVVVAFGIHLGEDRDWR